MGIFEFFKQLVHGWDPKEPQKQLPPGPDTIVCGLCDFQINPEFSVNFFAHWLEHTGVRYVTENQLVHYEGVFRKPPVARNATIIIRRPEYKGAYLRFNLEFLTADYFAYAVNVVKLYNPHMRFQYVNAVMGDSGYLKTLLIICEWHE